MINFKFKNRTSKNCAYCGSTPQTVMKNTNRTDENKIKKCPVTKPLHGLTRGMECKYKVGYRKRANVLKFENKPSKIEPEEQARIERWYVNSSDESQQSWLEP